MKSFTQKGAMRFDLLNKQKIEVAKARLICYLLE